MPIHPAGDADGEAIALEHNAHVLPLGRLWDRHVDRNLVPLRLGVLPASDAVVVGRLEALHLIF